MALPPHTSVRLGKIRDSCLEPGRAEGWDPGANVIHLFSPRADSSWVRDVGVSGGCWTSEQLMLWECGPGHLTQALCCVCVCVYMCAPGFLEAESLNTGLSLLLSLEMTRSTARRLP